MGLLDKLLISQEVLEIRKKKYNASIRKRHLKKMGLAPLRKYRRTKFSRFKQNVPKKLRKEWGERTKHFRTL